MMKKKHSESRKMSVNTDKPLILAVETSGRTGSVAVGLADEILAESSFSGLMRHSAELFGTVRRLLSKIDTNISLLRHIYIAAGPGSFTGIRIAVTMAKMMAFANSVKIVPVNTMNAIAANADDYINETGRPVNRIATIIDAKRSQFYIAVFEKRLGRWVKLTPDSLMKPAEFLQRFARLGEPE